LHRCVYLHYPEQFGAVVDIITGESNMLPLHAVVVASSVVAGELERGLRIFEFLRPRSAVAFWLRQLV